MKPLPYRTDRHRVFKDHVADQHHYKLGQKHPPEGDGLLIVETAIEHACQYDNCRKPGKNGPVGFSRYLSHIQASGEDAAHDRSE